MTTLLQRSCRLHQQYVSMVAIPTQWPERRHTPVIGGEAISRDLSEARPRGCSFGYRADR